MEGITRTSIRARVTNRKVSAAETAMQVQAMLPYTLRGAVWLILYMFFILAPLWFVARASWINDDSHPDLDAHVDKLDHFAASLADGVIDDKELATQEANLVTAMKAVEGSLSDDQHAKVPSVRYFSVAGPRLRCVRLLPRVCRASGR